MRILIIALVLGGMLVSACGGGSSGDTEETKALRVAISFQGDDPNGDLPPLGKAYQCYIAVATTPTPPAQPVIDVLGSCMWSMEQQLNVWYATFTETWPCVEFSVDVANYPPCTPPNGTHTWQYLVDPLQQVMPVSDDGNFAPDMKR